VAKVCFKIKNIFNMCGITGIFNLDGRDVNYDILNTMNSRIKHRGPDGDGTWIEKGIGLGHRRLSIIDLQGGAQPMTNEDETVHITFNGEIYNHKVLREQLQAKGHIFKSECDTEVIVHLYEEYGKECVQHLNGMFAFAVYDSKKRYILLARDRLGQKPLVFFYKKNSKTTTLAFSSELHSLKAHPEMPKEISPQALHDYLTLQYIPAPETIYKGVNKLPPSFILECSAENPLPRVSQYWKCSYSEKNSMSYSMASNKLNELLQSSVKERMMSDVQLGAFLSGGIDSTIITGLMKPCSLMPINTFSIGFNDEKYDERNFAKIAAAAFETNHQDKIVNPADFDVLEKLVQHYGEPYSDASMIPTYFLSKFAKESVTVALSGDGADELFAGYYRYLVMKYVRIADILPLKLRKTLASSIIKILPSVSEERNNIAKLIRIVNAVGSSTNDRYLNLISRFPENMKKSIYSPDFANFTLKNTQRYFDELYAHSTAAKQAEKAMEIDLTTYLPGDILTKVDIASMANSLEVRSPFMNHKLVEFAASLKMKFKQNGNTRKRILQDTYKKLIPKELQERKKMGFGVPIAQWLRTDWKDITRERLLDGIAVNSGYFNKKNIDYMINEHTSSNADYSYSLWSMLIFELWLNK
jgi:asparagine synthase (glutamine-hydrolysing)